MADLDFYRLSMTGEEADSGIRTGMEAGATSGVLLGDGNGGVTAATPGRDFGYPLLEGSGPPTGNTAANIGQHYFDMQATQAPYEYICVGLNSNGFIWLVFGDAGNGFIISGYFASIDALNAAIAEGKVPAPTPGVNYAIGTEPPYDTVTWDGVANDWKNNGPLGASGGGSGVPPHGDTGQVLTKLSDLDGDAGWKDIALKGEGEPTASTVGMIGQLYIDTTATENPAYICVGITTADNVTTYEWQPVGGTIEDGSVTLDKIAPTAFDSAPVEGSSKIITSGGVAEALANFTGGVEIVKLWENASPGSEFPAQEINASTSGYSAVVVITEYDIYKAVYGVVVLSPKFPRGYANSASPYTSGFNAIERQFLLEGTSIDVGNAITNIGGTFSTSNNRYCIPVEIYGIKGVA